MKKFLFSLMAIVLVSVSTNAQKQPNNSIKVGDNIYKFNEDNSASKYTRGVFVYDVIYTGYEPRISEDNNTFVATNPKTGEYFKIHNIRKDGDITTFDIETSKGTSVQNAAYRGGGGAALGAALLTKIVDLISDIVVGSDLQQCTSAMQALNCSPKTAYMNYSAGGWFSNPSCEVGCR